MFHPERDLKFVILELLTNEGRSISSLSRELEKQGYDIHRLILTGYLRALADQHVLKEKDVPPAKIYVPIKGRQKDIYDVVNEAAHNMAEGRRAEELSLYAMWRLFKRPIFAEELVRAGISGEPLGRMATQEERQEAKKILTRSGFKIPDSSRAYVPEANDLGADYQTLIETIVAAQLDISYLVRETKQTKLV
jgi:DNA-binding HxlR family transcriptional regulator